MKEMNKMGKKLLVITGSPRKKGNSDLLADALIEGAKCSGYDVTKFYAAEKFIQGCIACDTCWSKGHACSVEDDFWELEPLLEEADIVAFLSPLYWSSFPAQLKTLIDKLYAYVSEGCRHPLTGKECVLLMCGECEGMQIFDPAIETYKGLTEYLGWRSRGIITVPKVHKKGEIKDTDALHEAKRLGEAL